VSQVTVERLDIAAPFRPTERQKDLARLYLPPDGPRDVLASGAVRSGKTQAAARLIVEDALKRPAIYVVARVTYRELRDSTQHAMIEGDGPMPPLIPLEARDRSYGTDGYAKSDETVRLHNGSEIRFRNLEHAHTWLNVGYGGIMIDQAEEMDQGTAGETLYDTIRGRLSDPRGRRKLLLVVNPASTAHWIYRRFVDPRTRAEGTGYVHFSLADNAMNLPADYVASMEATRESRPYWYRTYVLGEWGAFEGAAYTELDERAHVVGPFALPSEWLRSEGMDHGAMNPTAWLAAATDYDGNLIVFDEYYAPGLIADHAAEIQRRRRESWWARDERGTLTRAACYADPSIRNRFGMSDPTGRELSVEAEYADHGIGFSPGQNDRRAGYARVRELLHPDMERLFPEWHPRRGQPGAPRLYLTTHCENLLEQLRSAPVKQEGKDALDMVDPQWEGSYGHAHAAARYLCLGRLPAAQRPLVEVEDPRLRHSIKLHQTLAGEDVYDLEDELEGAYA
jgi:phage terminase large subunit